MMNAIRRFLPVRAVIGAAILLALSSCVEQPEPQNTFTLGAFAPDLQGYDSARVLLVKPNGDSLLIFHGAVKDAGSLTDLPAEGYDRGKITIRITGYEGDAEVYRIERGYDGASKQADPLIVVRSPGMAVTLAPAPIDLLVGENHALPAAEVKPDNLKDKDIAWSSSEPAVIKIEGGRYHALTDGRSVVTAALKADTAKKASFTVTARNADVDNAPTSLELTPEILDVSVGGGARGFLLKVMPNSADGAVIWHSADTTRVRFVAAGEVEGIKGGEAKVWVVSRLDPKVADTALVRVKEEAKVESVRFDRVSLKIFRGGARESLLVAVLPPEADQAVDYKVFPDGIVAVAAGKVEAKAAGSAKIIAESRKDPTKRDTLEVEVAEPEVVDSVVIKPDSLKLYKGGADGALAAAVHPARSNQGVIWKSSQPSVATVDSLGKVHPLADGATNIRAISRLDSTREDLVKVTVKTDKPILNVTKADTNVSLGATVTWYVEVTQEHGGIRSFQWSLDGDTTYEGASTQSKGEFPYTYSVEGPTYLRLRVVDGEGNVETVAKKINVIKGKVVNITTPTNNSVTNQAVVAVAWTVNGEVQKDQLTENLKVGPNTIRRESADSAGKIGFHEITVTRDTTPPAAPLVKALSWTNDSTPEFKWSSGGQGGHGYFRIALDTASLPPTGFQDTVWTPPGPLKEGIRVLKIQERDLAGNWSATALCSIGLDLTPPAAPAVTSAKALTNAPRPSWKWNVNGSKRYKVGFSLAAMNAAAITTDTVHAPAADLADGPHTLFVIEEDAVHNWSKPGSFTVRVDKTPPTAPTIGVLPSPLNSLRPTWIIGSAANSGGNGVYRARVDTFDLANAPTFTAKSFTPPANLPAGPHTLFVQESDSAGNWSANASRKVVLTPRAAISTSGLAEKSPESHLAFSPLGKPYLSVFSSSFTSLSVHGYETAGGWLKVGNTMGDSLGMWSAALAVSNSESPYVSYANNSRVNVMVNKSGTWSSARQGLNQRAGWGPLAFNSKGDLYHLIGNNFGGLALDTLVGGSGNWGSVGPVGNYSWRGWLALGINSKDEIYVAYTDGAAGMGNRISVVKRAGSSWTTVASGLPTDSASDMALGFTPNGDKVLLSLISRGKLAVYEAGAGSSAWNQVGAVLSNQAKWLAMAMVGFTPCVAYVDLDQQSRIQVKGFHNGAWTSMHAAGISLGASSAVSLAVHPLTEAPWVAFSDAGAGDLVKIHQVSFDP